MKTRILSTARFSLPLASAIAAMLAQQSTHAQTVRSWTGSSGGAWLTTTSWSPSGTFAGGAPLANPTGEGANTDIMTVAAANSATNVGINMNTLAAAGGVGLIMGGIDFNKTNTATLQIGNSSTSTNGILQLNGATINSVPKTLIRVAGSANLTIANVNSGTGTQTMGLQLGITDGIFDVATGRTLTISSIISEAAASSGFTKTGAGTLTLSGPNTYTGATIINAGALAIGNVNALDTTSSITLGSATAATLTTQTDGITISAPITTANTGVNSTIAFARNTSAQGSITLNGAIGGNGNVIFTTPNVGGSGGNLQTINLGAAATYSGTTTIGSGNIANALSVKNASGAANVLPTSTVLNFAADAGNGSGRALSFDLNGQNQTLAGLSSPTNIPNDRNYRVTSTNAATLTINNTSDFAYGGTNIDVGASSPGTITSAQIIGAISLVKNGAGTLTLGGNLTNGASASGNAFTGSTSVLGGILVLGESTSIRNSAFDTTSSLAGDATNGLRTTVTTLTMGGLTGNKNFANTFTTTSGGYSGLTSLTLNPGLDVTHTFSGDIGDGAVGMTLTKTGAGTQTLTGTNTHTGATNVNAGALVVNGSISLSNVSVSGTGILKGSGSVSGMVTIDTGGTLASGNSIESLGVGTLSFAAGSTYAYELQTDLYTGTPSVAGDLTYASGMLDIAAGANLNVTDLATSTVLPAGSKITLISYAGGWTGTELFTFNAATLNDGDIFTLGANDWQFNYADSTGGPNFASDQTGATNFVTMTVVPEPSITLLGGLGLLAVLRRRR